MAWAAAPSWACGSRTSAASACNPGRLQPASHPLLVFIFAFVCDGDAGMFHTAAATCGCHCKMWPQVHVAAFSFFRWQLTGWRWGQPGDNRVARPTLPAWPCGSAATTESGPLSWHPALCVALLSIESSRHRTLFVCPARAVCGGTKSGFLASKAPARYGAVQQDLGCHGADAPVYRVSVQGRSV